MTPLSLAIERNHAPTVLCLGAHSDDIEIGAGATVLALLRQLPAVKIVWVVFAGHGERERESRASAEYFTADCDETHIEVHDFRDGHFPYAAAKIKQCFEVLKASVEPDIVLTHYRDDRHQDHRVVSDLTWQTFRNHFILEYEIPKYDGDFGSPNFFYPVADELREKKLLGLETYFGTQQGKNWFSRETFNAVMRLRGVECQAPTGYAEAFYCRKAVALT